MRILVVVVFVLLVMFPVVSCADDADPAVTLNALFAAVLDNHPSLQASENELAAAGAERDAASWGRFPTLGFDTQVFDGSNSSVLRLEQPLWAGGRIQGQIDLTAAQEKSARANMHSVTLQLLDSTAQAFFDSLRWRARVDIAKNNEQTHRHLLTMIERRVQAQISPEVDLMLAQSRLNQASNERLLYEQQLAGARIALEELTALPLPSGLVTPVVPIIEGTQSQWEAYALQFSPERARLQADLEAVDADIRLAKAQSKPSVVAGHEWRTNNSSDVSSRNQVYIAIQYEPGAGLSSLGVVRAAEARRLAAEARVSEVDRDIRRRVAGLWSEIQSLTLQEPLTRATLSSTEATVDSYVRQFQVGKKSWLDVLNVQREKAQAEFGLADVEAPLLLARLRLMLWSGQMPLLHGYANEK